MKGTALRLCAPIDMAIVIAGGFLSSVG
jgi:hypothetical protein